MYDVVTQEPIWSYYQSLSNSWNNYLFKVNSEYMRIRSDVFVGAHLFLCLVIQFQIVLDIFPIKWFFTEYIWRRYILHINQC